MMDQTARADLDTVDAAELKRRIPDLTERIDRQEKRVQRIQVTRDGPAGEMADLLTDMVERRDAMRARLADIEAEPTRP